MVHRQTAADVLVGGPTAVDGKQKVVGAYSIRSRQHSDGSCCMDTSVPLHAQL